MDTARLGTFLALWCPVAGLLTICCQARGAQNEKGWVPYSAQYVETVTTTDASGHTTSKQQHNSEVRAADGSLLTVELQDGQRIRGKLWTADGKTFALDFGQKRAVQLPRIAPRHHSLVPPDAPAGVKSIAGLQCVVYPLHGQNKGTICVDENDDIPVRTDVHVELPGGVHEQYTNELTAISLNEITEAVKIPEGFMVLSQPQAGK